ncbi:50S ribosomal protein L24 [Candidatus Uhrbacteria bacterium CG_4_10_14_0_2_um_filter_41_7]|uniref:Large ribosomal subunit protein uL24 n=1 Tax=Candidatus Uhrbacteria bacterium CG_4_9_14_3_um_filter_41_35 TaxID=1975034 RepID=A0A2M7XG46_9BACT|nr:MAG: 50S ribosomal protein L24 [Candidatus Uhrbacteria bacterium CG11_big_fil_rev_8_21_14_0_20_41_9]PIZ53052.1 MAG: 50S ribosomal protein L24 [Candidatus Uhrbacteria bacterium CG_4_10_14_0_2_um_filter_41_7]PJA46832.1 MAG: 50S ribosomal protein L24 [Candidatus Uhrbacteria bacterium CG_4_9_14_3_um_filter_41_35]
MKVKTGDNVRITAGRDKGKTGKVIQVFPKLQTVVVENINKTFKHLKKRGDQPGQRIEYNAPIHISNVQVSGKNGVGRVGYKTLDKEGKNQKVRVLKTKKGHEDLE